MLDENIKSTLPEYFKLIESNIEICYSRSSNELELFLKEISEFSKKIRLIPKDLERTSSFTISKENDSPRITFSGIPLGHEFSSFIMALLQVSGRKPRIDDELITQIKHINQPLNFKTYISLGCHNCPDVVQALNIMSVLNPMITHEMIDGALFQDEVKNKDIMALPTTYLNDKFIFSGKKDITEIVSLFSTTTINHKLKEFYDITIVGGGPAAATAAIYSARKGLKTLIIADKFGGQILDTQSIENFISVKETEGKILASQLQAHVKNYDVDLALNSKVEKILKENNIFKLFLDNQQLVISKSVILSTGARWRELNIPGEMEFKNKGVAYCPHCDGPLFKGRRVAVVGGGNSGVEAAIDLSNIVEHVTLLEYADKLKADKVLQDKLRSLNNVSIITSAKTQSINGSNKVESISFLDMTNNLEKKLDIDGVFVQIGLVPNTSFVKDFIELNKFGEIVVDKFNQTNIPGVFAAGDCTDIPYKQIISSMGAGVTASLSAFDYLIRST